MPLFMIPAGHEARVTCYRDASLSRVLTDHGRPLRDQVVEVGAIFSQTELGWLDDGHGAENDDWLVRVVDQAEPLLDGVETRP